jgi:hypothetical protein
VDVHAFIPRVNGIRVKQLLMDAEDLHDEKILGAFYSAVIHGGSGVIYVASSKGEKAGGWEMSFNLKPFHERTDDSGEPAADD